MYIIVLIKEFITRFAFIFPYERALFYVEDLGFVMISRASLECGERFLHVLSLGILYRVLENFFILPIDVKVVVPSILFPLRAVFG